MSKRSQFQHLYELQQKGLKLLKEHKTRKQPAEASSDDSDSEAVSQESVIRLS